MPVAVVTGASRGFGLALVKELAERGWESIVDARDGGALEAAVAGVRGVTAVPGNVADHGHRSEIARAAAARGRVDLLVNNASTLGPSPRPPLAEYPLDERSASTRSTSSPRSGWCRRWRRCCSPAARS